MKQNEWKDSDHHYGKIKHFFLFGIFTDLPEAELLEGQRLELKQKAAKN